jgi:hypothetical protein
MTINQTVREASEAMRDAKIVLEYIGTRYPEILKEAIEMLERRKGALNEAQRNHL